MESRALGAIEKRYSGLAQAKATLSCGSAVTRCHAEKGEVCVDLGCGRGGDVLKLASRVGMEGRVIGVDATQAMLDAAIAAASAAQVTNVSFVRSSLEALELPDDMADWVVSNCALNHARDKARVWAEVARVLKPGGRFVVSDIYAVEAIDARYRDDPEAVAQCWAGAETRAAYLEHVAQAGLVDVSVSDESDPYERGHARLVSFTLRGSKRTRPSVAFEGDGLSHAKR